MNLHYRSVTSVLKKVNVIILSNILVIECVRASLGPQDRKIRTKWYEIACQHMSLYKSGMYLLSNNKVQPMP